MIYHWRKEAEEYGQGSFPGNSIQKMTPEEKELADLKEKNAKYCIQLEKGNLQLSDIQAAHYWKHHYLPTNMSFHFVE